MAGSYFFDANAGESYEDTQRKRAIAEALMSQPWTARTPGQSIAQAAERIAGALIGRGPNKADKAGRARYAEQFEGATSPFPAAPAAPSGAEPTDYASSRVAQAFGDEGKPDYRSAIAKIESGGRYDAVGPTHAKMGRALGRYQIMEANLPSWSQEALGRPVTAEEFMANPQIQDAIFDKKFGSYVQQFGPEGAAQAWLGGPGGVGKTGRKDSLGTSIGEYGQKFMGNLGQPSGGVQKIAQALSGGGQPPEMAGNVMADPSGPSQQQLMQLAANPYASDSQKAIVNSLLEQKMRERQMLQEQQMKQATPDYQLDLDYKRAQIAKMQREASGEDGTEYGLNPQYGVDAQGNPVLIQIGKNGTSTQTPLPDGVSLSKEPIKLDAGTHFVILDPITRQPVGTVPKNLAGAEAQKAIGEAQGKASAAAPGDFQAAQNALDLVDSLVADPNRQRATGGTSLGNWIPSTAGYDYQSRVDKAKSGAFLTAIQQLRGMGALSNAEGETATRAVANLDTAQTEEGFMRALSDYRAIVEQGMAKAQAAAQRGGVALPPQAAVPAQPQKAIADMTDEELEALANGQ